MALIYHDPEFRFAGCDGLTGCVDLQVFYRDDGRTVVVVSENLHDVGQYGIGQMSVTQGIEIIATRVVRELGFDLDYLVEHYPLRAQPARETVPGARRFYRGVAETFDLVNLAWDREQAAFRVVQTPESWPWKHVDRATAEAIVGEALPVT